MNIVVIFDSIFGNTAKVAAAIAGELEHGNAVRLATVQDAASLDLSGVDLLIFGSPTRGFRCWMMTRVAEQAVRLPNRVTRVRALTKINASHRRLEWTVSIRGIRRRHSGDRS